MQLWSNISSESCGYASFEVSRKCEKKVAIIRYSLLFLVKSIDNYVNCHFSHTKYVS
jgi:hypothetical protein